MSTNTTIAAALAFASAIAAAGYAHGAAADPAAPEAFPEESPAQVYLSYPGSDAPASVSLVDSDGRNRSAMTQVSVGNQDHNQQSATQQAQATTPAERAVGTK